MTNGLYMLEMTYICGKWLKFFEKRLKYVGNEVDLWEMAQIVGQVA